jgi:ribosomal protein L10
MGLMGEIIENKEELVVKLLDVLQGKEATARVKLDGVKFNVGKVAIKLSGEVDFTFVPPKPKK